MELFNEALHVFQHRRFLLTHAVRRQAACVPMAARVKVIWACRHLSERSNACQSMPIMPNTAEHAYPANQSQFMRTPAGSKEPCSESSESNHIRKQPTAAVNSSPLDSPRLMAPRVGWKRMPMSRAARIVSSSLRHRHAHRQQA